MKRCPAAAAVAALVLAAGCSDQPTGSSPPASSAAPTTSAAPAAASTGAGPGSSASSATAIKSIDCGTGGAVFSSLEQAWSSGRPLTTCETTLDLRHRLTEEEQQAVQLFQSMPPT